METTSGRAAISSRRSPGRATTTFRNCSRLLMLRLRRGASFRLSTKASVAALAASSKTICTVNRPSEPVAARRAANASGRARGWILSLARYAPSHCICRAWARTERNAAAPP